MLDDTEYQNEYDVNGAYGMDAMPTDELDQPTEEGQPEEKKKTPRPKGIGKYIFLALLFALLSLGGLAIGFIGGLFKHPALGSQSGIDATILGKFINIVSDFGSFFNTISAIFEVSLSAGIITCLAILVFVLPVLFALISLIMFIVAIATKKLERARTCAYGSGILTLLAYGALFLYTFAIKSSVSGAEEVSLGDVIDYSCLAIAGASFVVLFLASCVRSKKAGFLHSIALLFTIICALCVYYPGTLTSVSALIAFDFASNGVAFFGIAFPALIVALVFNLIFSSMRLNAKRGLMFDTIRYGLQLLALILTIIATISYPFGEDRWALFKDTQLIITVILLVLSIACLFIPMFALIYRSVKRRAEKQAAAAAQYPGDAQDASYSDYNESLDNGYQNNYAQPAADAQQNDYVPPQPEAQQAFNPYQGPIAPGFNYQAQPQAPDDPDNVVVTIDTDDLQNLFNMQPEPEPAPQPEPETLRYQAPEPEPEVLNTHEPVVIKEVIREVIKEKEPEPARPELTEFERRMAALAKSSDTPKEPEQDRTQQQRPHQNTQQSGFRQSPRSAFNGGATRQSADSNPFMRQPQQPDQPPFGRNNEQPNANRGELNYNVPAFAGNRRPNSYVFGGSQYTYDPFINTLTPMEKNEFGDVFIANLYGIHSYLPTYVIGGDNTEFFQTIFIHLGRFRGNISHELMEKIYAYVSKM